MQNNKTSSLPQQLQNNKTSSLLEQLQKQEEEAADPMAMIDDSAPTVPTAGPEIPETGLPDIPDTRPAADLAETEWQAAPSKPKEGETEGGAGEGYQFPPDQAKDYDYSEYYMHYYQQAYQQYQSELL